MAARGVILIVLLAGVLAAGDAAAQGMMLTEPRAPAPQPEPAEAPARRPWAMSAHQAVPRPDGRLPNQATGPKRERVVRDICIGCNAP